MTTVTETNNNQQEEEIIITNREIPSSCLKEQQQHQESHSTAKPSRLDVSSSDCEEMPPQPGAVHMIGSRVMTAEQQEEDAWDLEENDDEEDNENEAQEEERPPSVDLGTASLHSNRSSCAVEAGNSEDAVPVILKETYVLPTEIQAEAVDEQQEAKLLEILHAPVVHGETVSPGYARYLLPISLTCTLLSVMGIAGMAVFVFVIRPSEVQPVPTLAPTLAPSFMPTMTFSMYPTVVAPPLSSTFLVPSNETMLDTTGGGNGTETMPPVLSPLPEIADVVPVSAPVDMPLGRTTMPPSPDSEKIAAKKPTLVPTLPPKRDNLDSSPSQPSTLAMGFISTLIALTAVIALLAFVAHWQIRKRAQGQQQSKEQLASEL